MKEKSHKGQRHKGCAWCSPCKQLGNGEDRRPAASMAADRREIERALAEVRALR
jgi:hypothetical protein